MTPRTWIVPLGLALVGSALAVIPVACVRPSSQPAVLSARFTDTFDRASLGPDWNATSGAWSLVDGHLHVAVAHNHPVWLRRRLPREARIEFDAWSSTPEGDIKCEAWGDGHTYATEDEYTASSYVLIFGGWHNQLNVIARMNEHGTDRQVRQGPRVVPGQHYHWQIERHGNVVSWAVDGQPMLEFNDAEPLVGPGHEYFAFNDWAVELQFDNLVITPL